MTLSWSLGQGLAGRYCAADQAFGLLQRQMRRLPQHSTWHWFTDAFTAFEEALDEVDGYDDELADALEQGLTWEGLDDHLRASELCESVEEFCASFFVTLQTRLSAVAEAARTVYGAAAKDSVQLVAPARHDLLPASSARIWHVANYVKHHDEWTEPLKDPGQRRSLNTLVVAGAATGTIETYWIKRFPLQLAVRHFSGEDSIALGTQKLVAQCSEDCQEIAARVQSDFAPFEVQLDELRAAKQRSVRMHSKNGQDG